ncbi:MAG: site-2 protease family protein [Clostridia bacterium]|nr:site-2 protease family protein [Clostridia bacterium]
MLALLMADAKSVFTTIGYIIVALLTLMVMIVVHEFGHYSVGKLLKFKINEFSIGFGPPLIKHKKKNGEIFSIRLIPLGGFCAFEGEDKDSTVEGAFNAQKPWKRILVLLAGVTFNFISAFLILTVAFCIYGYTLPAVAKFNAPVEEGVKFTLEEGDIIYQINGKNVYTLVDSNVAGIVKDLDDGPVEMTVLRNVKPQFVGKGVVFSKGEKVKVTGYLGQYYSTDADGNVTTYRGIGIMTSYVSYRAGFWQSFAYGVVFCVQVVVFLFQTIGGMFTGLVAVKGNLGGPITTVGIIASSVATGGFRSILVLLGMMSANIAIMNVLPLPALDGSRVVFTVIEWIRGKPIPRKVEAIIHFVGLILLFGATILFDILNLGMIAKLF